MPQKNEDPKGELPPIWTDTKDEPKDGSQKKDADK